ncbi:MAG: hypothetical protein BIFFINMI_01466 [Phycisphaerae bacterium]|nr:hypothetical protein [Phycisphaerae bacterium]
MTRRLIASLATMLVLLLAASASADDAAAPDGRTLLTASSYWQAFAACSPQVVSPDLAAGKDFAKNIHAFFGREAASPAPPADWAGADFDDAAWLRTMGPFNSLPDGCKVLYLRRRLNVADPAAVSNLTLSLDYAGGAVVYLNGREVARADMPAGPVDATTPATVFPLEAFVEADGEMIPVPYSVSQRIQKGDKELAARVARRKRHLAPTALPADALRKGANVLAIELHRSDLRPEFALWGTRQLNGWPQIELTGVRLSADGTGIAPAVARPAGVQVWNGDCHLRTRVAEYGATGTGPGPITLAGARNGTFAGKVIVGSDKELAAVKAEPGALARANGPGTIPADAVQVRYAVPTGADNNAWLEPMSPAAPDKVAVAGGHGGGAMVEVWVIVRVPADAAAGDYAGTLAMSVGGAKVADVPVKLHVADWILPAPRDWHTFTGVYQSPTDISYTYDEPMWSERHWKLEERSLSLVGELGSQMVQIPVVDMTRLGNEDGWLTWVKKDDGSYDYDWTVIDRYLGLVKKHLGAPRFVVLHVYHPSGWGGDKTQQENTVTVLDPKTGQKSHVQVPEFGGDEGRKFWTPVMVGLREHLAKVGMGDSLVMGSLTEGNPPDAVFKMFADILGPGVRWLRLSHRQQGRLEQAEPLPSGGQVLPHVFTYVPGLPDPDGPVVLVNKPYWPRVAYYRDWGKNSRPLMEFRLTAMNTLYRRLPGFTHLCLDFWPVKQGRRDRGGLLWGRWPRAGNYPGDPEPTWLTWPAPDGAEPVAAFHAIREGMQEAEAFWAISEALEKNAGGLGDELAARCRKALQDELKLCAYPSPLRWNYLHDGRTPYTWQDLSRDAYALAGEVARAQAPAPGK